MIKETRFYLIHILENIALIQKSILGLSKEEFVNNKDVLDAGIRRIEVIGEATKSISLDFREKYPYIEWKKIAGTRDILIHSYFKIDFDLLWEIIDKDLPVLEKQIKDILAKE